MFAFQAEAERGEKNSFNYIFGFENMLQIFYVGELKIIHGKFCSSCEFSLLKPDV
jgi:hypothetical protein